MGNKAKGLLGAFGVAVVGIMMMLVVGAAIQNRAVSLEEQVKTANSDISVQEKRRVDLIYNLVDCVKSYDKYEAETLLKVIESRGNSEDVTEATTAIMAVTEAYPELKASENYKELMNELAITENKIAEYRSAYNQRVRDYSRYIKKFPNKAVLEMTGYESVEFGYLDYDAPSDSPKNIFGE